jgi:hypothetical protein
MDIMLVSSDLLIEGGRRGWWQWATASSAPSRNHYIKNHVRFILNKVDNRSILTRTPSSPNGRPE